jgi:carboxylesterase
VNTSANTDANRPAAPTADPAVAPVLPGAEPWSFVPPAGDPGRGPAGVLTLHGFTGSPSSMRGVAEAFGAAGYHVELPRLPGHGTSVDEMLTTTWADWCGEVESAYRRLAERTDRVVVAGLSMGGSLALWTALQHRDVCGLVLVNPATQPQPPEVRAMLGEMIADGTPVVPGIGSDIAEPGVVELAYDGTPLAPLVSFLDDGLAPMADRYGELTMPLLLFTSRQDHVVEPAQSEHLAATYGGPVDHRWLERSFHVATQDYERHDIVAGALEFAARVTAPADAAS